MFRIYDGHIKIEGPQPTVTLAHGGAGPQDPSGSVRAEALHSLRLGLEQLNLHRDSNEAALEMAEYLESDPLFNAGLGACLQDDGVIRVSASYMDSIHQKFSAVINAEGVLHPARVAKALQNERHCVLDGWGTKRFVESRKDLENNSNLYTADRISRWLKHKRQNTSGSSGTIGVVTVDPQLNLAAITSTGGVGHEVAGRVGDSPTVAGNFCTKRLAVSCTGYGEQITSDAVAARLSAFVDAGNDLRDAVEKIVKSASERGFSYAFICLSLESEARQIHWVAAEANCMMVWGLRCNQEYRFSN